MVVAFVSIVSTVSARADEPSRVVVFGTVERHAPRGAPVEELDDAAFDQDIAEVVAKAAGLKYRFVEKKTAPDVVAALESGEIDVIPSLARPPEKGGTLLYSVHHSVSRLAVFVRTQTRPPRSIADVAALSLAVPRGSSAEVYVTSKHWLDRARAFGSTEDALHAVQRGESGACIVNQLVGVSTLKKMGLEREIAPVFTLPDYSVDYCMAVRRSDVDLLGRLNDGILLGFERGDFEINRNKWLPVFESYWLSRQNVRLWFSVGAACLLLLAGGAWLWYRSRLRAERRVSERIAHLVDSRTAALKESQSLYQSLVEQLPAGVFRKDAGGRYVFVSEGYCRLKGLGAAEFLGRTAADVAAVLREKGQASEAAIRSAFEGGDHHLRIMETGKPIEQIEELDGQGRGGIQYLRVIKAPVLDPDGKVIGSQGVQFDVTEAKRSEERLRKQAALLDSTNDSIFACLPDYTIVYWNEGAARLYGVSPSEAIGRKINELRAGDEDAFANVQVELLANGQWTGEVKMTRRDGKEIFVFCRWTLMRDAAGAPKEVMAIDTDITEKKQLEVQYLRAQRMEGIGMLAGGIAHDLNNILTPILMSVTLLRRTAPDADSIELLESMKASAQRGAEIIRQLLTFARGHPSRRAPVPVRQLIDEIQTLIRGTFPRNIRFAVSVSEGLWSLVGDATQVQQALMNLLVNARDAMPDGGTLTLSAENVPIDAFTAARMPGTKPGPHLRLRVADTGAGIPSGQMGQIFDPFFTTKEIGKGTGLGLPTVLGIVKGHGGAVRVDSTVGQGTTVDLYFPASSDRQVADLADRPNLPHGNGECILVVDDEATIRAALRRNLERFGYKVLVAAEGAEALALFRERRAEIKAVLTDMMMPGMDGPKLLRALWGMDPRLPILGMTGLGEQASISGLEGLGVLPLLAKPFEVEKLLESLRQKLTAARSGSSASP